MVEIEREKLKKGVDYTGINCVFFCHDDEGRILLQQRSEKCRDEQGAWGSGGGALEFGEDPDDCTRREVREEYGAKILDLKQVGFRNVLRENKGVPTHWFSILYLARLNPDQVKIGDPEKMSAIGWYFPDQFPSPLHSTLPKNFEIVRKFL